MKKVEKEKMNLPNLAEMTDIEAIHWYTKTVRELTVAGTLREHRDELLAWKKKMNEMLLENRKKGWEE
jgi:hypothetical protein